MTPVRSAKKKLAFVCYVFEALLNGKWMQNENNYHPIIANWYSNGALIPLLMHLVCIFDLAKKFDWGISVCQIEVLRLTDFNRHIRLQLEALVQLKTHLWISCRRGQLESHSGLKIVNPRGRNLLASSYYIKRPCLLMKLWKNMEKSCLNK